MMKTMIGGWLLKGLLPRLNKPTSTTKVKTSKPNPVFNDQCSEAKGKFLVAFSSRRQAY